MNIKYLTCNIIFSFFIVSLYCQQTQYYQHEDKIYRKAIEFYEKKNYGKANDFFQKAYESYTDTKTDLKAKSQYYSALCAIKLYNKNSEYLINKFVQDNPESPLINSAYFQLANYFLDLKKYRYAISYYSKIKPYQLDDEEKAEYYFNKGYCHFMKNDLDNARVAFYEILKPKSKYSNPAIYYYSHIHYSMENYQTALEGFLQLTEDKNFGPIVPYYITQIYYHQEKYNKVIEYAPGFIDNVTEKRVAEVARIIGESYFKTGKYQESIPYFEKYFENAKSYTQEDLYQFGYAYYKSNMLDDAAKIFGRLSSTHTSLAQNALYHLADCYLKLNKKHDAQMAFFSCSKLAFDKDIQEDALYNYAVLTFELSKNPFNEAIYALNDYINKFPNSKRRDDAYNYLMMAYMNANNYKMALASIEKISNKNSYVVKAFQKIAFYRGLELYNLQKYFDAVEMLEMVDKHGSTENKISALSRYWLGEAYFKLNIYDEARLNYLDFTNHTGAVLLKEYKTAHYGIAYSFFQQKLYQDALTWFRKYYGLMKNMENNKTADALNRIGDCFFIQKDYYSAIDFYNRSINIKLFDTDYAMFQKGLCLGIINNNNEKISVLKNLTNYYPNSLYVDDAIYETGIAYTNLQKPEDAVIYYQKITTLYPNSSYASKALLNIALYYYNKSDYSNAIASYKKVLQDYSKTEEAKGALSGLKNIYIDQGNVDEYFSYVNGLNNVVTISVEEQDSVTYIAAENLYLSGDCDRSSVNFKRYIEKYPNGSFLLNAHFYKGDCNYQAEQYDEAIYSFKYVIEQPKNIFTEQALLGISRTYYKIKDYKNAIKYYSQLEINTDLRANILEARIGQMRCFYNLEKYEEAADKARLVINSEKVQQPILREAKFKLAKSLRAIGRNMPALEAFKELAYEVSTDEGGESKYRIAEILFNRGELEKAEQEISDFTEKPAPNVYWMARSFLLWSDIFVKRNDNFQAIQTLQSIIDYYIETNDDILATAKSKLNVLKKQEKITTTREETEDIEIDL